MNVLCWIRAFNCQHCVPYVIHIEYRHKHLSSSTSYYFLILLLHTRFKWFVLHQVTHTNQLLDNHSFWAMMDTSRYDPKFNNMYTWFIILLLLGLAFLEFMSGWSVVRLRFQLIKDHQALLLPLILTSQSLQEHNRLEYSIYLSRVEWNKWEDQQLQEHNRHTIVLRTQKA